MTLRSVLLATVSILIVIGLGACDNGLPPPCKLAKEYLEERYPGVDIERTSLKAFGHGAYESLEGTDFVEFYGVLEDGRSISGQVVFENGRIVGVEEQ